MTVIALAKELGISRQRFYQHKAKAGSPAGCDIEEWRAYLSVRRLAGRDGQKGFIRQAEQAKKAGQKDAEAILGIDPGEPSEEDAQALAMELKNLADPSDETGAAAALKRLQELENVFHRRLVTTLRSNAPARISMAREDWLKVSESLRKYDLAVEQSRRDSQEQIPREDAAKAVRATAVWLRLAVNLWLSGEAPQLVAISDPSKLVEASLSGLSSAIAISVQNSANSNLELPRWAMGIVREEWHCV